MPTRPLLLPMLMSLQMFEWEDGRWKGEVVVLVEQREQLAWSQARERSRVGDAGWGEEHKPGKRATLRESRVSDSEK